MEIKTVEMSDYSSLRIGGKGRLVVVSTKEELKEAAEYAQVKSLRIHILGGGTNSLFGDDLSLYLFIKNEIKGVSFHIQDESSILTAYAGEIWDNVVKESVERGLWGIENLSYIPGNVGAAPVQNIGAYGTEIKDVIESVEVFTLDTFQFMNLRAEECDFAYRDSLFKRKPTFCIVSITMTLSKNPKPILTYKPLDSLLEKSNVSLFEVRDLVINTRKTKLPDWITFPNAGSFFKNPTVSKSQGEDLFLKYPSLPFHEVKDGYKIPAAWLIEHIAKMKGVRDISVGTWPNQPLVIVNYGKASLDDLKNFYTLIIEKVKVETGIVLEREVNVVE